MLTLSHQFLHCHTDFLDCDTKNELHNVGLKNKIHKTSQKTRFTNNLLLPVAIKASIADGPVCGFTTLFNLLRETGKPASASIPLECCCVQI